MAAVAKHRYKIIIHIIFILLCLLQKVHGVTACIADYDFGTLSGSLGLLDEILSAVLGKRRDIAADLLAVVLRSHSDIGIHYRLFNLGDHALLPRLNQHGLGIRSGNGSNLRHRCRCAVIIYKHIVENGRIGLAYTVCLEILFKISHSLFHLVVSSSDNLFCSW